MKIIVTAALPYANGELHLGHIKSTYLPADIYTRFRKLRGDDAIYLCATDEHGTPILFKAESLNEKPEEYIKKWRKRHLEDLANFLIRFDMFFATHTDIHEELTQYFYEKIKENKKIEEKDVKQYWCSKENRPLPDRYVKGKCPFCGAEDQYGDVCEKCGRIIPPGALIDPYCAKCGAKAIVKDTKHIFFKLSDFSEELKSFIEKVKSTDDVKNYLKQWLKDLKDWDIERDIEWGVKIPDRNSVFYVWFDAPIGYISTLKAYCRDLNCDFVERWNNSYIVHFIGKDIIYHHFLFWPAMLMNTEFKLPDEIQVRGYLTLEKKKFSKSRNWYISLKQWIDAGLDPEYLRFYFSFVTPLGLKDSDFSAKEFAEVVNENLVNNIGNLLYRLLKFSEKYGGEIRKAEVDEELYNKLIETKKEYERLMLEGRFMEALHLVTSISNDANAFFQNKEPWKNKENVDLVISTIATLLKEIFKMLYPFMPIKSRKALELLNFELDWQDTSKVKEGHKFNRAKIIFPKIKEEDVEKIEALYKGSK